MDHCTVLGTKHCTSDDNTGHTHHGSPSMFTGEGNPLEATYYPCPRKGPTADACNNLGGISIHVEWSVECPINERCSAGHTLYKIGVGY